MVLTYVLFLDVQMIASDTTHVNFNHTENLGFYKPDLCKEPKWFNI